jgi:DNA polymerase-3 subunit epsilon
LGIDLDNRHRAGGDADATAILFTRLLAWDTTKEMDVMIENIPRSLPPNLPREDFEQLPEKPGVYYFIMNLKVIYVGKAVNLKKRVASHFVGIKLRYKDKISYEIYMLSLLKCGTELMALLLEYRNKRFVASIQQGTKTL